MSASDKPQSVWSRLYGWLNVFGQKREEIEAAETTTTPGSTDNAAGSTNPGNSKISNTVSSSTESPLSAVTATSVPTPSSCIPNMPSSDKPLNEVEAMEQKREDKEAAESAGTTVTMTTTTPGSTDNAAGSTNPGNSKISTESSLCFASPQKISTESSLSVPTTNSVPNMSASDKPLSEMRIVLVGKTGVGKSGLGNSLLMINHFKSNPWACSVTPSCQFGARKLEDGTNLVIVDTPGIFDTSKTDDETFSEVARCIGLSSPGPHAFFFVLTIGARFTQEENNTIECLKDMFGNEVMKFVTVVFTRKDDLEQNKISLDEYVRRAPPDLTQLIQDCNGCYVAINNIAKPDEKEKDVQEILNFVRKTMERNRGMYYTGEMFEKAEKLLKEKLRLLEEEKHKKNSELEKREKKLAEQENDLENKQRQLDIVAKKNKTEEKKQQQSREKLEKEQRKIQEERDRYFKRRDDEQRQNEKKREDQLQKLWEEQRKIEVEREKIREEKRRLEEEDIRNKMRTQVQDDDDAFVSLFKNIGKFIKRVWRWITE